MIEEVVDKSSGAILFKRSKDTRKVEELEKRIRSLESRIEDLEKSIANNNKKRTRN